MLQNIPPSVIGNWTEFFAEMAMKVSSTAEFNSGGGFCLVEKEYIKYSGRLGPYLTNITRGMFGTESPKHLAGTTIHKIISAVPDNPFKILLDLLSEGGVSGTYIDTTAFNNLLSAWSNIKFSCIPVVKNSKLGDLFFDAVNMLDCISWVNESGLITIRSNSDTGTVINLTDEKNIIYKSDSVDLNQGSRRTRFGVYWHRTDPALDIKSTDSYRYFTIAIDAAAESQNEYNDKIEKLYFTIWINENSKTGNYTPEAYTTALMNTKRLRWRDAKEKIVCELETKDSEISVGRVVAVTTDIMQDIYGANYSAVNFDVIKKELTNENKFKLTLLKR